MVEPIYIQYINAIKDEHLAYHLGVNMAKQFKLSNEVCHFVGNICEDMATKKYDDAGLWGGRYDPLKSKTVSIALKLAQALESENICIDTLHFGPIGELGHVGMLMMTDRGLITIEVFNDPVNNGDILMAHLDFNKKGSKTYWMNNNYNDIANTVKELIGE